MIKKKEWDSDFFNFSIGEININDYTDDLDLNDYRLLYVFGKNDFDILFPDYENTFAEQKVVFQKNIFNNGQIDNNIYSFKDVYYDLERVYKLAFESGKHSRFLLDENFSQENFENMYKTWIDNSINGSFAHDLLLYKIENEIVGLLTYQINNNTSSVGLIGILNTHQGNGIGGKMLKHLESVLFTLGIKTLTIPTQHENKLACSFYKKQGYEIKEITFIKHYWKKI